MFVLPRASLDRLDRVHPELRAVILRAAEKSKLGFVVTEGERSMAKQRTMVDTGASKTMHSRHVPEMNQCQVACAVDLAVWFDDDLDGVPEGGEIRWDGALYFDLAYTVQAAAKDLGVPIVWGGCWSNILETIDLETAQAAYVARKKHMGDRPLIDGPHFELDKKVYP